MTTAAEITAGVASLRRWLEVWQLQVDAGPIGAPDSIDDLVDFGLTRESAEAYAAAFDAADQAEVHEELRVRTIALRWLLGCVDAALGDQDREAAS